MENFHKNQSGSQNLNSKEFNAELSKRIKKLCLFDDTFMTAFFDGQNHLMEFVLKIILNTQDLKVLQTKTQYEIRSIGGRSARLDALAVDSKGKRYNFEVQNADKGAIPQRARFNSAMLDSTLLNKNDKYENLPETYIIFFTKNDVLKANLPIYNIERIITQNGKIFGDGCHIIYVNGSYKAKNALGKLVEDFHCQEPTKMHFGELAERSNYLKYETKGEQVMSDPVKRLLQRAIREKVKELTAKVEARAEAKAQARAEAKAEALAEAKSVKLAEQNKRDMVKNLLKITDLAEHLIAASSGLLLEEVEELSRKIRKNKVAN